MDCPICSLEAPIGIYSLTLKCGHRIHTKCWDKKSTAKCKPDCQGIGNDVFEEPRTFQGHDYVANPQNISVMTKLRQIASGSEAFQLVQNHCSVKKLVQQHNFGLQRLLHEGFDMDDFCAGGYSWEELQEFRDMRERPKEALIALGCTAEHFRDYPNLLPVGKMDVSGRELVEKFGFAFPEDGGPAGVVGGKNDRDWTAADLVKLGFKYADLVGADMRYLEQYAALKPSDEDEDALGVTDAFIDALPSKETPPIVVKEKPVVVEKKKETIVVTIPVVRKFHGLRRP